MKLTDVTKSSVFVALFVVSACGLEDSADPPGDCTAGQSCDGAGTAGESLTTGGGAGGGGGIGGGSIVTIAGTPANGASTNQKVNFTFSVPIVLGPTRFQCSRDGASFFACTSPQIYGFPTDGSADGLHSFSVRALDRFGNPGPFATRTFVFDSIAPTATIVSADPADGSVSTDATWTLGFTSNEPNVTFECLFDGSNLVSPCVSGASFPQFDGQKTAVVRAIDAAGNVGPFSNQVSYRLDTQGPNLINIMKPNTHNGPRTVTISWSADEPVSSYTCTFGHVTNPVPCAAGSATVMEGFSTNFLDVTATDLLGNVRTTAIVWTVN